MKTESEYIPSLGQWLVRVPSLDITFIATSARHLVSLIHRDIPRIIADGVPVVMPPPVSPETPSFD